MGGVVTQCLFEKGWRAFGLSFGQRYAGVMERGKTNAAQKECGLRNGRTERVMVKEEQYQS